MLWWEIILFSYTIFFHWEYRHNSHLASISHINKRYISQQYNKKLIFCLFFFFLLIIYESMSCNLLNIFVREPIKCLKIGEQKLKAEYIDKGKNFRFAVLYIFIMYVLYRTEIWKFKILFFNGSQTKYSLSI